MATKLPIKPVHSRMARAALGWSLAEASSRSNLSVRTIHRFETGARLPKASSIGILYKCFIDHGVSFDVLPSDIPSEAVTVAYRPPRPLKREYGFDAVSVTFR